MIEIYHNPRCRKSREALKALEETGVEFRVVEYLKNPPDADTLSELLGKLGMPATELLRKNEAIWKEAYRGKELSNDEIIEAMDEHPKLIERPIVIKGDRAVIARPADRLHELI